MLRLLQRLRVACLVVVAGVVLLPVPYQHRVDVSIGLTMERDVVSRSSADVSFLQQLRNHREKRERLVIIWWFAAAGVLTWSELERRGRLRAEQLAPWARGAILVVATIALFTRKIDIFRFGRLDPLAGVVAVDVAGLAFLVASFFAWTSWRAASRAAARAP